MFALASLVFDFGDWHRLTIVSVAGFIGAPEIELKMFKNAWLIQLLGGAAAGALVGFTFASNVEGIIAGALIGGILGWLAPYWIKHV